MKADIWSIGVVYYQMIFGKYPYYGESDIEIRKKIKTTKPDFSAVKISLQAKNFI
jgi:serine/threonine protein kinase